MLCLQRKVRGRREGIVGIIDLLKSLHFRADPQTPARINTCGHVGLELVDSVYPIVWWHFLAFCLDNREGRLLPVLYSFRKDCDVYALAPPTPNLNWELD